MTDKLFGLVDLNARLELTRFKPVRALFKSRWFPLAAVLVNTFLFVVILLACLVGGYSAGNYNFGIMIVWILWWVMLMFVLVPVFARAWCLMCPFPIFSDWLQRGRLLDVVPGRKPFGLGLKWPTRLRNMWLMNVAFLMTTYFSGFMTVRPMASFILLGLVILTAFIVGLVFERRNFCLYLCPVSGFQGLYAQFAMVEVRRKDPEICRQHKVKTCYLGNECGHGCPWLLAPFNFQKNTYCGMCLECFKTCPYDNMGFNLRPPGADLLVDNPRAPRKLDEAWKAFIMLGIAINFYLAFQGPWGWLKDMVRAATWSGFLTYILYHTVSCLVIIPAIFLGFAWLSKRFSGNREVPLKNVFTNFAYTLVPLGLGVWIAFSLGIILPNGSYLLHILSDPFAWGWNLFGTANFPWTPVWTAYLGYVQGATMLVFYLFTIAFGYRIAKQTYPTLAQARRGWTPIWAGLTALTVFFVWLYTG
jgi:polyferredoxin